MKSTVCCWKSFICSSINSLSYRPLSFPKLTSRLFSIFYIIDYFLVICFAHSAHLPKRLYIWLVLISFFTDRSESNYLRIPWTDFHDFFTNDSYLFIDDRSTPLFFDSSMAVAMATYFGQNWQNDLYSADWCSETDRSIAVLIQKYVIATL